MIKDSKLIGTKIAAPFGWKKFKVGELFDMHAPSGNGMYSSADGSKSNRIGFIRCTTSSRDHNGVPICLPRTSFTEILKRGISVASNGDAGSVFYHSSEFAVLQDSYGLTLKTENDFFISDFTYLFLCSVLNKQNGLFSYTTKAVWSRYCALEIELPVTSSNQLDFAWMEQYMKQVQEDYLKQKELSNQVEIKAYLTEGHTDSLQITDADRQFLRDFEKVPRRKFKVGELFDKRGPIADRTVADCSIPYSEAYRSMDYINCATAGIDNNGCPLIVSRDVVDESYIMNNCITVSANGVNTGSVFVQTEDFCVLQDSYALIFKRVDVNVYDYLFVAALLSKYSDIFDYQVKANWTRFSELMIELPVTDSSQVDVHSIEKYMQIQVKLTIAKRKSYLDHELELMKQMS